MGSIVQSRQQRYPAAFMPCSHKHLRFKSSGALISCVDCPRLWHIVMPQIGAMLGGIPDVGYFHPTLSEMETRHTPYEPPRTQPLPKPPVKAAPPAPRRPPPVQKTEPAPEPPAKPRRSTKTRTLLRGKKS